MTCLCSTSATEHHSPCACAQQATGLAGPYVFETYGFVLAEVTRQAQALLEDGYKAGDRVGMMGINCPEYVKTMLVGVEGKTETSETCSIRMTAPTCNVSHLVTLLVAVTQSVRNEGLEVDQRCCFPYQLIQVKACCSNIETWLGNDGRCAPVSKAAAPHVSLVWLNLNP